MANSLTLPQQIARSDSARLRAYAELLSFYQGDQWPGPLRRRERRLTFNYAKAFIEKAASYLMSGMHAVVDPEDGSPEEAERARRAEHVLQEVAEQNNLAQLDFDTEIDAAVLGDGAYKVTWDPLERRVRISAPDVQGLFVWWLGDDVSRIWRVASRYELAPDEVEIAFGPVATSGRRSSSASRRGRVEVVEGWTSQTFELWVDGALVEEKANPYGFIPFVIYPNLREPKQFWGASDLPAIREPVRELNRALSQLSMILELSGNPVAVLENVTEAQDIAVQPGAVWELPERARAYLLDLLQGGGVQLHVDYVNLIYRTLHDLGETPRAAFGESKNLSGVALNIELDPLLKKVQRKRLIRSAAYQRRNELALRLLEQQTGVSLRPRSGAAPRSRIVWGPLVAPDRSRLVADERTLVAAGIHSRRRAADELGVADPDAEFSRWLEEEALLEAGGETRETRSANGKVPAGG